VANLVDMTEQRFGRLVVLYRNGSTSDKVALWLCRCTCGKEKTIRGVSLRTGRAKSCGCLSKETQLKTHLTHGMSRSPEHIAYLGAKARCTNPKTPQWNDYGGRGIEFRFASFRDFFACVGLRPSPLHSLDRENVNGHYEPGNIRWVLKEVQQKNKRTYATRSRIRCAHCGSTEFVRMDDNARVREAA
jgi:hypothetical protein